MTVSTMGVVPVMDFADRLRKARRLANLSQEDMCIGLGVKQSRYGHWESGRNQPEDLVMVALAVQQLTGVSAEWLATGRDPRQPDGGLPHLDSNQKPFGFPTSPQLLAVAA